MKTRTFSSFLLAFTMVLASAPQAFAQEFPEIRCPGSLNFKTDPGECFIRLSESDLGNPEVTGGVPEVMVVSDFNSQFPDGLVPFGVHVVTWTVIDELGNFASCGQEILVGRVSAISGLTVDPGEQPYGGSVSLRAFIQTGLCGSSPMTGGFVHFNIGGQSIGSPIPLNPEPDGFSARLNVPLKEIPGYPQNGTMSPGSKTVTASFTLLDESIEVPDATADLDITPGIAQLTYTGPEIMALAAGDNGIVSLPLTVMLKTGPGSEEGDIRNASVRFRMYDASSGGLLQDVTVPECDLLNDFDPSSGMAECLFETGLDGADSRIFRIDMTAGGYFEGSQSATLTLYHTDGDFMAGGGHFTGAGTCGTWAADPAGPVSFAFHVRYNRRGTNLTGKMHINYDILAGTGPQTLQIRANQINTLGVDVSGRDASTGTFTAKASLVNLSTGREIAGNLQLQVKLTDRGEPGSSDAIGFTLWGTGQRGRPSDILFSTSPAGVNPEEYRLDGGNLIIHSGFSIKNEPPVNLLPAEAATGNPISALSVYPNPSKGSFMVDITLNRERDVVIDLVSADGREVRAIWSGHATEGYTRIPYTGKGLAPGLYFVRLKTGLAVKTERMVIGDR